VVREIYYRHHLLVKEQTPWQHLFCRGGAGNVTSFVGAHPFQIMFLHRQACRCPDPYVRSPLEKVIEEQDDVEHAPTSTSGDGVHLILSFSYADQLRRSYFFKGNFSKTEALAALQRALLRR
jgi:hypothetical protein